MVDDLAFDDSDDSEKNNAVRPPPSGGERDRIVALMEDNYGEYVEEEMDEDDYNEEDDYDGGDAFSLELGCPFCSEDYDALGLCLHIQDQHLDEAKWGVCPVCAANAGRDMVSHLIIEHESMLKALHRLKRRDQSCSTVSSIRKKLLDESQRYHKASATTVSSINVAPDPLLLSFINSPLHARKPEVLPCKPLTGTSLSARSSDEITSERFIPSQPLSETDHGEEAKKCEFVRTLLFSTIFHDEL